MKLPELSQGAFEFTQVSLDGNADPMVNHGRPVAAVDFLQQWRRARLELACSMLLQYFALLVKKTKPRHFK